MIKNKTRFSTILRIVEMRFYNSYPVILHCLNSSILRFNNSDAVILRFFILFVWFCTVTILRFNNSAILRFYDPQLCDSTILRQFFNSTTIPRQFCNSTILPQFYDLTILRLRYNSAILQFDDYVTLRFSILQFNDWC